MDPEVHFPEALDTDQWLEAASSGGAACMRTGETGQCRWQKRIGGGDRREKHKVPG